MTTHENGQMKLLTTLAARILALQSRCDAMELMLGVLAKEAGLDVDRVHSLLRKVQATCHEAYLLRAENQDPASAALLDMRR